MTISKLTIKASHRGKVPSCYVGKTFDLELRAQVRIGHNLEGGRVADSEWDSYTATMKNGKTLFITHYFSDMSRDGSELHWFVRREGSFAGTWLYEVTAI